MNNDKIIASKIEYANSFIEQIAGLMFRLKVPWDFAIVYDMKKEQPIQIHTCFCFHPIDALFLDNDHRVIQMYQNLHPWILAMPNSRPARYFVETLAGRTKALDIHIGDRVVF